MKFPILIALLLLLCSTAHAQNVSSDCVVQRNSPPTSSYYWPPDTHVRVFFVRGMFNEEQQQTLVTAMESWNLVSARVGAGVSLRYAGLTETLVNCQGCLTVTRRAVFKTDRRHYAFFNPLARNESGLLVSAWIDLDYSTTDAQALRSYMVHELGHGMGLWDCKLCKKRMSIMNAFSSVNRDNGLLDPSLCDIEVVKTVYELERRVSSNFGAERE